jgi:archaellum biogenesis ATPase FlaH
MRNAAEETPIVWDFANNNTLKETDMSKDSEKNKPEPGQTLSPILFKDPLPLNQEEVDRRSSVRLYCLQNMPEILNNLFPDAQKITKNRFPFKHLNWTVFHKPFYLSEASTNLPAGGWFNDSTHEFGFDMISLYAAINASPSDGYIIAGNNSFFYNQATERLADFTGISMGQINTRKKSKNPLWIQKETALIIPPFQWSAFPEKYDYFITKYHSKTNQIVGYVEYYRAHYLGERYKIYHTLWAQHKGQNIHWQVIFPQKPYILFNLYAIYKSRDNVPVVFVGDEESAVRFQEKADDVVYTTCPGGLINLPHADLSALRGRKVVVELASTSREVKILPDFIKKAKDGGINVAMVFNGNYNKKAEDDGIEFYTIEYKASEHVTKRETKKFNRSVSAEEFLKKPYEYGYEGRLYKSQPTKHESGIIKPGEKIPGANKKREILLHPEIIEEGYIVWLYALKNVGKTIMALSIAYAVAKGNRQLGAWCSKQPKKVLYVFGEGKPDKIDKSIKKTMAGQGDTGEIPFSIILAKKETSRSFNILDPLWQERNKEELKSYDLIIFDDLQCLTTNKENEIKLLMEFINRIAQHDTAVLVLDHTSRKGKIQESISKGMSLDLEIKLEKTKQKKIIKVSYPAARYMDGDSDFLLRMVFTEETFHFEMVTQVPDVKPDVTDKIKKLARIKFLHEVKEMSFGKIGKVLKIVKSTAHRQYTEKITKLPPEEKELLNQEFTRLVNENLKDSKDMKNP